MPTAYDRRIPPNDHDPLVNLLDFGDIDETVEASGDLIRGYVNSLRDGVINFIESVTGIDLSNWQTLLDGMSLQNFFERFFRRGDHIPISSLADIFENLLINPLFSGADAVADNPFWDQDTTIGHGASNSLKVTADGTLQAVRSDPVEVINRQDFPLSIWVKWSGFESISNGFPYTFPFAFPGSAANTFPYTFPFTFPGATSEPVGGDPIRLEAIGLLDGVDVGTEIVATIADPTQSSDDYPGNVDGWVELAGVWTAPDDVDEMVMRLVVDASASIGTIWFSDASRTRIGRLLMQWVDGLQELFSRLFGGFGGQGAWVQEAENFLTNLRSWIDRDGTHNLAVHPDLFEARALIPHPLQDVIDNIFDGFHHDGVSTTEGNPISSILDALFGTKNIGVVAQDTGNTANSGVARIEARLAAQDASGTYLFDGFDYTSADNLPATYTKTTVGTTLGNYGPNGQGETEWNGLQGTVNWLRNDAALTTDNGEVHAVVSQKGISGLLVSNPDLYLIGRSNLTATSNSHVQISANGNVKFRALVSGTLHDLSPQVNLFLTKGITLNNGDHIIYRFGTQLVARKHVLIINDQTAYEYIESGTTSQIGPTFRHCGFGGHAEFLILVYPPPRVAAFVMSDQAT